MTRFTVTRMTAVVLFSATMLACSDQPMAPSITPHAKVVITGKIDFATYQVVDFTVDQYGGWFSVGPHSVYFPANSICDPAKSSYGPTEFDKPCSVITKPIAIRAEIQKSLTSGKPAIHFTPDLRFSPTRVSGRERRGKSLDPQWVMLYMYTAEALKADTEAEAEALEVKYRILWTPVHGAVGVDESIKDATLKTRVLASSGLVYRRVKHFSGYQVGSGFEMDLLGAPQY